MFENMYICAVLSADPSMKGGARLGGLILRFGSGFPRPCAEVFRFPRPCAEVFFMLSEGAGRGFRKWFFKAMCRGVVGRRCSGLSEVVIQSHVLRCF